MVGRPEAVEHAGEDLLDLVLGGCCPHVLARRSPPRAAARSRGCRRWVIGSLEVGRGRRLIALAERSAAWPGDGSGAGRRRRARPRSTSQGAPRLRARAARLGSGTCGRAAKRACRASRAVGSAGSGVAAGRRAAPLAPRVARASGRDPRAGGFGARTAARRTRAWLAPGPRPRAPRGAGSRCPRTPESRGHHRGQRQVPARGRSANANAGSRAGRPGRLDGRA